MPSTTTPTESTQNAPVTQKDTSSINKGIVAALLGTPVETKPVETKPAPEVPATIPTKTVDTPPTIPSQKSVSIPDVLFKKNAQKPAVTKPTESSDFDPDSVKLEELSESAKPNFARLRDKWHATEKALADAVKERDELKSKIGQTADPEEVKRLREEHTKALDAVARIKIEADPRFVAKWNQQAAPVEQTVKSILGSYDVKDMKVDDVVAQLRRMPAKDRPGFLSSQLPDEVAPTAMATILPMLGQLDVLENAKMAEIANHKQTVSLLDQQSIEHQERVSMAARESVKRVAFQELAETEPLFQKVDGNDEWNQSVDALIAGVDVVFKANDPKQHAKALIESRLTPMYRLMFVQERQRREELENVLRSRNISLPNVGDATTSSGGGLPAPGSSMTAEQAVARVSAGLRR